jgi:hypothetical protein
MSILVGGDHKRGEFYKKTGGGGAKRKRNMFAKQQGLFYQVENMALSWADSISLSLFHACILAHFAGVLCALPNVCSAGMLHFGHDTRQGQISKYGRIYWGPIPHLVFGAIRTYYYHSDSGAVILNIL